jgi:hypothetical protein
VVAVVALLALVAVLVWYQSGGVSTRQRWRGDGRFGQLAPEPPWPKGPIDADARFEPVPASRVVVPAVAAGVLAVLGVVALVVGAEPLGVLALFVGVLEAGAAISAARQNRRAIAFALERLLERPPSGSGGLDGPT